MSLLETGPCPKELSAHVFHTTCSAPNTICQGQVELDLHQAELVIPADSSVE